nr:retrovirus-related Pol polyprotein from transposon TNT 1-94 [Tanacetum cinerariifolium]
NGDQPLPRVTQVSIAGTLINDLKKCGYSKDNCELNFKFLNNLQPEWKQYATMMRQNKNLMDINIDALYNILKQNQGDVNDAMGSKKKTVVVTSDPLALIASQKQDCTSIPMYCDSKAAISISCNHVQHSHTKYINVRYHFIKEKVEKGIVELFFVGIEYQLADLFTKALPVERFKYLVRRLGMRCLTPAELKALANESA